MTRAEVIELIKDYMAIHKCNCDNCVYKLRMKDNEQPKSQESEEAYEGERCCYAARS